MDHDRREERMKAVLDRIPDSWGKWLSYSEGWDSLILNLDAKLAELDPNYELHQVKEKFGGLRFYAESSFPYDSPEGKSFNKLIEEAELAASTTCELCGATEDVATKNTSGWVRSLCTPCRDAFVAKREAEYAARKKAESDD